MPVETELLPSGASCFCGPAKTAPAAELVWTTSVYIANIIIIGIVVHGLQPIVVCTSSNIAHRTFDLADVL